MPSAFSSLQYLPCTGAIPGRTFTAPSPGPVIAVTLNGILLRRGGGALLYFTEIAGLITLSFDTEEGDRIYALCVAS